MPTNSKRTKKQTGPRKSKTRKSVGIKGKGTTGKGGTITVKMATSMWNLLHQVGVKIYTQLGSKTSKLDPKYADPICLTLADHDEAEATALKEQLLLAHQDFVKAGDWVRFAP